jgi:polyisoprenyl-teichoic acid--peptidoglycan teichoic acid transferase
MTFNNRNPRFDPNANTQPFSPLGAAAPVPPKTNPQNPARRRSCLSGCAPLFVLGLLLVGAVAVYFLFPLRTNVLLLGADRTEGSEIYGRTDTIILTTVIPLKPYVGMLSIPRDLWVPVPGHGENRINTANYFAEIEKPGSGPQAAMDVVQENFKVPVGYYVRIRFSGFKDVVTAMGGVDVDLPNAMAGLPAGKNHLDGDQALAFVRERESTDDFHRMAQGQLLLKAALAQMMNPAHWDRIPAVLGVMDQLLQTNVPAWDWPRLGLAVLRAGPGGIDNRVVSRDMVQPFVTSGGADVLAPQWDKIRPVVSEMFGVH